VGGERKGIAQDWKGSSLRRGLFKREDTRTVSGGKNQASSEQVENCFAASATGRESPEVSCGGGGGVYFLSIGGGRGNLRMKTKTTTGEGSAQEKNNPGLYRGRKDSQAYSKEGDPSPEGGQSVKEERGPAVL